MNIVPNSNLELIIISNLDKVWTFWKKVFYKLGKISYSIPLVRSTFDKIYETKVAKYKASLPKLSVEDQVILETLEKDGTFSIPIEDLQLESTESFLETSSHLVECLKNLPSKDKVLIDLDPDKLKDCPEIFLWGIEERLLNIIEHYIGLPVYYQGYSMRRDIVTNLSAPNSVRAWHLDAEDRKIVKIIVYLNDVGLDGGHYEYIPKDLTKEAAKKLNYNLGYVNDQSIMTVVPQKKWNKRMGKKGTVIIATVSDIFHRAKPPEKEDRFSISFCYTSNKPKFNWNSSVLFPHNLPEIYPKLSEKQRNALINKNKFFGIKL